MAVTGRVHITELLDLATDFRGNPVMAGKLPGITEQVVAIGGTSAASSAFSSATRFIRIDADTACYWTVGADPTADAADHRYIAAGSFEYVGVEPGHKLAVIAVPS